MDQQLTEKWENGELGRDEKHVQVSAMTEQEIDELLALQAISIRMPKSLLQDLKNIAELNGMGYQPLIKQILTRFVDGEKKMIANELIRNELEKRRQPEHVKKAA